MTESIFQIGAEGVDADKIVQDIEAAVNRKLEEGVYNDARVAQAERTNMANLKDHGDFLDFYMRCLGDAAYVDISDFEIRERRSGVVGKALIKLKKVIWSLLKFYTFRMWTQQNQVNGLFVTAIESLDEKYREQIEQLEARVKELEGKKQ